MKLINGFLLYSLNIYETIFFQLISFCFLTRISLKGYKPKTIHHHEQTDEKCITLHFHFPNNTPLNDTNFELEVNFLESWERQSVFPGWVADPPITGDNLMQLTLTARTRFWQIIRNLFQKFLTPHREANVSKNRKWAQVNYYSPQQFLVT